MSDPNDDEPITYVCGFVFDKEISNLILVRKLRPMYQRGKLNGIIDVMTDDDPDPISAMERVAFEKLGVPVPLWFQFNVERFEDAVTIHYFIALNDEAVQKVESLGEPDPKVHNAAEPVQVYKLSQVPYMEAVPSLQYLIAMAVTKLVRIPPDHLPIL